MATFAKQAFNAGSYAAIRPTYPRALFDAVYAYHAAGAPSARWTRALDLGCGTGQATMELTAFRDVVGVEPSTAMVTKANELLTQLKVPAPNTIRFVQSSAEDLACIENASVDLVVSAQAVHWFDYAKLWPELARVLRRNGSVAFWGYSQFRIGGYPALTPLIHEYSQGSDPATSLGPYWEQPGRAILDNHLLDVVRAPEPAFKDHKHIFWTGEYYPSLTEPQPIVLRKNVSWEGLQAYLRTFSSLYTFHERNPADAARRTGLSLRPASGEGGDIVERFWWSLQEAVARENGGDAGPGVEIEWPMAMLLCRRA